MSETIIELQWGEKTDPWPVGGLAKSVVAAPGDRGRGRAIVEDLREISMYLD